MEKNYRPFVFAILSTIFPFLGFATILILYIIFHGSGLGGFVIFSPIIWPFLIIFIYSGCVLGPLFGVHALEMMRSSAQGVSFQSKRVILIVALLGIVSGLAQAAFIAYFAHHI
jgi:hypothetical protein